MKTIRHTLVPLAIATITLGCTSGSDAVSVPGADDVAATPTTSAVTLPVESSTVTESATDDPDVSGPPTAPSTPTDAPPTTAPRPDDPVTTPPTTAAPPTTESTAPETAAAPPSTDAPADGVYLRVGDEGDEVGLMQFKLSVLGYLPTGADSGVFDEATNGALRRFQADYGLGVDGVFGPLAGRALNAAVQSVIVET